MTSNAQTAHARTPSATDVDPITTLGLERKVHLLTGASMFTLWPEPSIGLHELRFSDGPTGVRGLTFTGGRTVALFRLQRRERGRRDRAAPRHQRDRQSRMGLH